MFSERYLESVVDSNERAVNIARVQLEEGVIDTLSMLQIQARVVAARASLIGIQSAASTRVVGQR